MGHYIARRRVSDAYAFYNAGDIIDNFEEWQEQAKRALLNMRHVEYVGDADPSKHGHGTPKEDAPPRPEPKADPGTDDRPPEDDAGTDEHDGRADAPQSVLNKPDEDDVLLRCNDCPGKVFLSHAQLAKHRKKEH